MIIVRETTAPQQSISPERSSSNIQSLSVVMTGVDGSTWDLIDGPATLLGGIKMLGTAKPTHWHRESPAIDGSVWQGMRTPMRDDPVLPIRIDGDRDSTRWRELEDEFFKAIDPRGEFAVTVTRPDAQSRTLRLRYADGGDPDSNTDPMLYAFSTYVIECVAADPFWRGETIVREFRAEEQHQFFPGPPFYINSSNTTTDGKTSNPGDVEAWPKWTVGGPSTAWKVGVGASVVEQAAVLLAGEERIVDEHPAHRSVRDGNGKDRWSELLRADFAPIPPGEDVGLSLDLQGVQEGTYIRLEYTPGYRRAW